jgi:predicted kinase
VLLEQLSAAQCTVWLTGEGNFSRGGHRFHTSDGMWWDVDGLLYLGGEENYAEVLEEAKRYTAEAAAKPPSPNRATGRRAPVTTLEFEPDALVLVGGLPGVGKSTLLDRVNQDNGAVVFNPDHVARELCAEAGITEFSPRYWRRGFQRVIDDVEARMAHGSPTLVHFTGLHRYHREDLAYVAEQHSRPVHLLFLDGDSRLVAEGQASRSEPVPANYLAGLVEKWELMRADLARDPDKLLDREETGEGFASVCVLDREAVDALQRLDFGSQPTADVSEPAA